MFTRTCQPLEWYQDRVTHELDQCPRAHSVSHTRTHGIGESAHALSNCFHEFVFILHLVSLFFRMMK